MTEWFKLFDTMGGPAIGRKPINEFLYKEKGVDPWWTTTVCVEYERARDARKKDGTLQGYMICVSKTIGASANRVYDAFTKSDLLAAWFAGKTEHSLAVGGTFKNNDGNQGAYQKLQPGKALKFTWEGQDQEQATVVEVKFDAKGDSKCSVMLAHDRIANRAEADGLRKAWGDAFDALKAYLET
jgi:uncharacterized protein YndB with AHSA1/START domain